MDPEDLARKYVRDADALATAKRHDEAVVLYDLAIDVDPDCPEAWTGKASVLRMLGKRREALECVEMALETGPFPIAETLRDILIEELKR
jgi:tetratricopeptide (TPR) repeat protein